MKLSAFTVITKPDERGLPWIASINSVFNWADEVVIVDGSPLDMHEINKTMFPQAKWIHSLWPDQWSWEMWPKQYNLGLKACTGDWAIRFDTDYVYPDSWKDELRPQMEKINDKRLVEFIKRSAITATTWYSKGYYPYGFNIGKYKDMAYGVAQVKTDLLVPIMVGNKGEGFGIMLAEDKEIMVGILVDKKDIAKIPLEFFNYDHVFKHRAHIRIDFHQYSMAYKRYFGETPWGETPNESFNKFIEMMQKRIKETEGVTTEIPYDKQPSFIQVDLATLDSSQWGHSKFGL